jgi:hypothetical protein
MIQKTPEQLVASEMAAHPLSKALISGGKRRDQLLRSLIPLYVAARVDLDLHSGEIERIWKRFRVKYAAPNAAKALREHEGYAKKTARGRRITRTGIKYVESMVKSPDMARKTQRRRASA